MTEHELSGEVGCEAARPATASPGAIRRAWRALGAVLVAAWPVPAVLAGGASGSVATRTPPYVRVVEQDAAGLRFTVRIPDSAVGITVGDDGRVVEIERLGHLPTPGHPELPVLVVPVGVPEHARIHLSYVASAETSQAGPPIAAVARIDPEDGALSREPDPAIYAIDAPWPAEPIAIDEVRFRGLRIARLRIHPARYNPATSELLLTSSFDIRLEFSDGDGFGASRGKLAAVEDRIVDRVLLNGAALREGLAATARAAGGEQAAPVAEARAATAANPGVKIRVATEGLVRITRPALEGIGFDPGPVDPRNLEMSYRGQPIPCRVRGEADGIFDASDVIEFYGVPATGRFLEENTYWLEEKDAPGLRYATRAAAPGGATLVTTFPHTEHYEGGNSLYTYGPFVPTQEGDPHFFWLWFENSVGAPRITTYTHSVTLPGVVPSGPDAKIRALFMGRSDQVPEDPDHRTRFFVNNTQVGDVSWNGYTFFEPEFTFDAALLLAGSNAFKIDFVPIVFVDRYYLDWIEVTYPRATAAVSDRLTLVGEAAASRRYQVTGFSAATDPLILDVTDPFEPVQLTGATASGSGPFTLSFQESAPAGKRYHVAGDGGRLAPAGLALDVPSHLKDASQGADLIVVVPDGWESALAPLAAHREAQGLRVVVASLTDVADEFAGGNVDDVAIRDFVAHAYASWQPPAVSYLLLVGEPNQDALNYLQVSPFHSYMPIHLGVTVTLGETMTDTWFGDVVGNDLLPDVAVGRFSVRTPAEAAAFAAKVIDYETHPPAGAAWGRNVIHIASNDALFEAPLEQSMDSLPSHYTVDRQYRRAGAWEPTIAGAFASGGVMASFVGHGNVNIWADDPNPPFYWNSSVSALTNAGRLPMVNSFNCLNGMVGHPVVTDSMAEVFTKLPTTGALAMWTSTALGYLEEFNDLHVNFYQTVFEEPVPFIGDATVSSLVETYLTAPVSIDLVKELILIGDPSGWLTIDTDNDQATDALEIANGLDPKDRDSDDDGLLDGLEGDSAADADGDGWVNALDPDSDDDGLPDGLEVGITGADTDTDVSQGHFRPDTHPASTTSRFDADTDDGGVADGAEDRDADGAVDAGETDVQLGADDPTCPGTPPEVAAEPGSYLMVSRSGGNVLLSWGSAAAAYPCLLHRIYVADDFDAAAGAGAFSLQSVTGLPTYTHVGGASDSQLHRYLIVGATLTAEGPWGHFD